MKLKVWVDSRANIHSMKELTVNTELFGFTDEEWLELPELGKEELLWNNIVCNEIDWGFSEEWKN